MLPPDELIISHKNTSLLSSDSAVSVVTSLLDDILNNMFPGDDGVVDVLNQLVEDVAATVEARGWCGCGWCGCCGLYRCGVVDVVG